MTDKKIKGLNFNHFYYADDKGNTTQFEVDVPDSLDLVGYYTQSKADELLSSLGWFGVPHIQGKFKVTIEFHPDTEDEVEDE